MKRIAAFGLAVWLTGLGCLFGCEMNVSAAATNAHEPAQAESCHAMAHDCCHAMKSHESGKSDTAQTVSLVPWPGARGEMSPCPFANPAAESARKAHGVQAVADSTPRAQPPASEARILPREFMGRVLVPDRGGTYLRCCVFLI